MTDKVIDPKKDALIAFTAKWCGYCRAFAPTWNAVEIAFHKKLQTINLDETEFSFALERDPVLKKAHTFSHGFPTMILYKAPKGKHEATFTKYEGSREINELIPAISKMAGIKAPKIPKLKEDAAELVLFGIRMRGGVVKKGKKTASPKRAAAASAAAKAKRASPKRASPMKKQAGGIMSSRISLPSGAFA